MPPTNTPRPTRGFATRLFWGVARGLALVWIAPALIFNVDWSGHGTWQNNSAAVVMILASALFFEGAVWLRSWVLTPVFLLASFFLTYGNTKQAVRVVSLSSEAASEAKLADIAGGSHLASHWSHLLVRRQAQAEIAGETAAGVLKAQLEALQLSDPRAWSGTDGCMDVTTRPSAAFCARIATARGKIEAAKKRDELDAELSKLPVPKTVSHGDAPVADAYVANVVAILNEVGYKPSERLVKAEEAMSRALGFEVVATMGPACWLAIINMLALGRGHAAAAAPRAKKPARQDKPAAAPASPTLPDDADNYDRCIADCFDDAPGAFLKAKDIRPIAKEWFDTRNVPMEESKLWAKLGAKFTRDANNGRPRYIGLQVRAKKPKFTVVGGTDP